MKSFTKYPSLLLQYSLKFRTSTRNSKCLVSQLKASEWTKTPNYPPISDRRPHIMRSKYKQDWYDKINKLPTYEQKIVEMNMPKYYGHYSICLNSNFPSIHGLDLVKYVTRTHVQHEIPETFYEDVEEKAVSISKKISDEVKRLILMHFGSDIERECRASYMHPLRKKQGNFIRDFTFLIVNAILDEKDGTWDLDVDREPRIEGAWLVGGFKPHEALRAGKANYKSFRFDPDETVERWIRCSVEPSVGIRSFVPLPDVIPLTHELAQKTDCCEAYDFKSSGFFSNHRRAVVVPGFWPGCTNEHGHLFIHNRVSLMKKKYLLSDPNIVNNILEQSIIMAGFTQAHSHAFIQGFTPFNEMSFPTVQQTVSTDGKNYKFALYQLNVCNLIGNDAAHNPYNNIMWISEDMPLYETIDNGEVKGLNEDVTRRLIKMFLKKGQKRVESYPFEENGYKYLMDHEASDDFKENFIQQFRFITSERPRQLLKPQIHVWERIYDGKFKMRFMFKRQRFYNSRNLFKPWERRFDDYDPPYIPKDLRANRHIIRQPKVDSELLFRMSPKIIRRARIMDDDPAFSSMSQTGLKHTRAAYLKHMTFREIKK